MLYIAMIMRYDLSIVETQMIRHRLAFEEYDQLYDSLHSCIACLLGNLVLPPRPRI